MQSIIRSMVCLSGQRFRHRAMLIVGCVLTISMLGGCASVPKGETYDPVEKVNRGTFWFNDQLDKFLLKPLSDGYVAVVPKKGRIMVSGFFDNALYVDTILNDFLQGKGKQGFSDIGRLLVNSTLGIGGLFDPATSVGLEKHAEDFGQTLGVWGFGQGAYLVLPVYGPNTVRDAPGVAVSTVANAVFWAGFFLPVAATVPISVLVAIDLRSRASNAIRFVNESALDPYVFTREAWVQHRTFLIYDGNPPETDFEDEFGDDEFGDEDVGNGGASLK
ncbi:MAG: VacJ family lipoprotein [Mariprofundaceae bacterium]|nr:VacJ family lipoprotein [Mariprofundaceae bacterium]